MVITYYGGECFKVQTGDTVIVFNPSGKGAVPPAGGKSVRFGADVALVSLQANEFSGVESLSSGEKNTVIISGPGEYEIRGIFIKGILTETMYGGEKKINTIYSVLFDGINLTFLGALGAPESITGEIKSVVGSTDILFVPIGGGDVLDPAKATSASLAFDPNVVIPMHYIEGGKDTALKTFLKEKGEESIKPIDKFTFKKKDIDDKEGEVVVLVAAAR